MKFLQIGLLVSLFQISYGQESYLLVGSGGGVAGTATVYKITRDGKVQRGKGIDKIAYTEEGNLKKCATKKYFKKAKAVLNSKPEFSHPGNLYSSITLYDEGHEGKMTWGDAAHPAPEDAKKLYQKINEAMARLTFAPNSSK